MSNEDEVVLYDSDDAAKFVTGISGWVSHKGQFFGEDEHLARWAGATHKKCDACDTVISIRGMMRCDDCIEKEKVEKYLNRKKVKWDGKTAIYSETIDRYFFAEDGLDDLFGFMEENLLAQIDMRFYLCEPVKYRNLDEDFFQDDLCEESELDESLVRAIEEFNKAVELAPTACWQQSDTAIYIEEEKSE